MGIIRRLRNYAGRWRRSRGFGVHSPFAYHFITTVLREKDATYYAYSDIAALFPRGRRTGLKRMLPQRTNRAVPEAWMLFRVLCYFNPQHIVEIGAALSGLDTITQRAVPSAQVHRWSASAQPTTFPLNAATAAAAAADAENPVVIVNRITDANYNSIYSYLTQLTAQRNVVVIVANVRSSVTMKRLWRDIRRDLPFGMGFTDGYMGVFVGRHTLPPQTFQIML